MTGTFSVSGPGSGGGSPVILIAGATASGKTAVAVELAKYLSAEVVSADSRQVYRYLDIGTAKPTVEEMGGIPHHGFDIVDPGEVYSAGRFAEDARRWIAEIRSRGKRVIVAGGSGLYLDALVQGFFGQDIKDGEIRAWLEERLHREGLESLYCELESCDPAYAAKTLPGDRQRILRALEVFYAGGKPFSELHRQDSNPAQFPVAWFGLEWPREVLYRRIDERVDRMFDRGLPAEVRSILDRGYRNVNAMKCVGYRELVDFFEGRTESIVAAKELIKGNSRRYAKRQLTWFRRNSAISWIACEGRSAAEIAGQLLDTIARGPKLSG